jgi:hypothetical protein
MRDDRDLGWLADPGARARLDEIRREREAQGGQVRTHVRFSVCKACGRRGLVTADRATCVVETFIIDGPKGAERVVGVRGTRPERCKRAEARRAA